jgi:predicted ATP-binding protein involved in virulence
MELKTISITNFKGIYKKSFVLNSKFNIVIGENAVGKTSLMEAIAVGLGGFVKGLNYRNGRSILNNDISIVNYDMKIVQAEYSEIELTANLIGEVFSWRRYRALNSELNDIEYYKDVYNFGKSLSFESKSGRFTTLPLISYYGTGRLMKDNDSDFNPEKTNKRIDGYNKALNPNSNYKALLAWFKMTEISVYKSGKEIDVLQSVKRAVRNCFEEIETLYYDQENELLSVILKLKNQRESKPVSLLSDGQRNLIGFIGDIALRCVLLNPHFGEFAHEKTPGIILIDELDLHLHPNWQKKIVDILKTTFPKMQFIATTHSPFIIQSLKNDELIDLQGKQGDSDYYLKGLDEIALTEMGVLDIRSNNYVQMYSNAEKYYNLLDKLNLCKTEAKKLVISKQLDDLENKYISYNPAYAAFLKTERKVKSKK